MSAALAAQRCQSFTHPCDAMVGSSPLCRGLLTQCERFSRCRDGGSAAAGVRGGLWSPAVHVGGNTYLQKAPPSRELSGILPKVISAEAELIGPALDKHSTHVGGESCVFGSGLPAWMHRKPGARAEGRNAPVTAMGAAPQCLAAAAVCRRQPSSPPCRGLLQEEGRTYKALLCERLGDPQEQLGRPHSALRVARLPAPPLTHPNSVRIRVAAAALNFADALQLQASWGRPLWHPHAVAGDPLWRGTYAALSWPPFDASSACNGVLLTCRTASCPQGQYQEKPKMPFVPGSECSGTVVEVGRDVRTLKVGDKVGRRHTEAPPPQPAATATNALPPDTRRMRAHTRSRHQRLDAHTPDQLPACSNKQHADRNGSPCSLFTRCFCLLPPLLAGVRGDAGRGVWGGGGSQGEPGGEAAAQLRRGSCGRAAGGVRYRLPGAAGPRRPAARQAGLGCGEGSDGEGRGGQGKGSSQDGAQYRFTFCQQLMALHSLSIQRRHVWGCVRERLTSLALPARRLPQARRSWCWARRAAWGWRRCSWPSAWGRG